MAFAPPATATGLEKGRPGAQLRGTPAGTATWQATPNLVFASTTQAPGIQVQDTRPFAGRLPIPGDPAVVTAEAELQVTPGAKGWLALGIGNPRLGTPPWGKGVYVILTPEGRYTLAANDEPADWQSQHMVVLKRGSLPEFSPNRPMKLKIEYDRAGDTVSLWAGGSPVSGSVPLAGRGVTVEPRFAGFSGLGQTPGHAFVTAFSVSTGASAGAETSALESSWLVPLAIPAWWEPGEVAAFRLSGKALPAAIVSVKTVLTTVEGEVVAEFISPRAEIERHGWTWRPDRPGFYEAEFRAIDQSGKERPLVRSFDLKAPATGTVLSIQRARQSFAILPPDPLDVPGRQSKGQFGFTYTLNQENIPLARLVGLDLANIHPIPWGANFSNLNTAIEPAKGQYRWELLDPHIDALTRAGMTIAGQFCYTPLWASPHPDKKNVNICVVEGTAYAPADIQDYARFVEATVRRYGDRIRLWELWNEPAIPGGSVFWSDTPENFVRLMEAGYTTIKRLQPDSEVWIGGLGSRSAYYAFYNRIQQLGASRFYDVLSQHGSFPDRGSHEFRRIDTIHDVPAKPAVVSEWHAILQGNMQSTPILAEDALSFRLLRDLARQLRIGIRRTLLFEMSNLTEKEALGFARENKWFTHSSGLFRKRPQPEPRHAAVVLSNFLRITGRQATVVREFSVSTDSLALLLDTARGPLALVWSETGPLPASSLSTVATPASTLLDWEGRAVSLVPDTGSVLPPGRFYYLTTPDTAAISRLPITDKVVSRQVAARAGHAAVEATYQTAPLFKDIDAPLQIPSSAWINTHWKGKAPRQGNLDAGFSARAAVGASDAGLDIVVEVNDTVHSQQETSAWWNGDSLQIAIDCEGIGISGGNTELIAALTPDGPLLHKILAADPRGDIPARWTPAGNEVRHAAVRIERNASTTRYRLRVEWPELYPLANNTEKPLRLSLAINNNDGSGRNATLEWGSGIVSEKDPSAYGLLRPVTASFP
ncbi:hypothetical protein OPIT5_05815 [Opitutaceae bacterium TAV5]|nr:hypothetical protein OPIT5_05815 [Opitutaceae bacterium TAV5]